MNEKLGWVFLPLWGGALSGARSTNVQGLRTAESPLLKRSAVSGARSFTTALPRALGSQECWCEMTQKICLADAVPSLQLRQIPSHVKELTLLSSCTASSVFPFRTRAVHAGESSLTT